MSYFWFENSDELKVKKKKKSSRAKQMDNIWGKERELTGTWKSGS